MNKNSKQYFAMLPPLVGYRKRFAHMKDLYQ